MEICKNQDLDPLASAVWHRTGSGAAHEIQAAFQQPSEGNLPKEALSPCTPQRAGPSGLGAPATSLCGSKCTGKSQPLPGTLLGFSVRKPCWPLAICKALYVCISHTHIHRHLRFEDKCTGAHTPTCAHTHTTWFRVRPSYPHPQDSNMQDSVPVGK